MTARLADARLVLEAGSMLLAEAVSAAKRLTADGAAIDDHQVVTERVAWLLVAASKSAGTDPSPRADLPPTREEVSKALARHALPSELEAEIHTALEALFTPPPSARRALPTPPARSAPRGITTSG